MSDRRGVRSTNREADPISEHLTRRNARSTGVDARARRYALQVVRPSPARLAAPEPDAWLPIFDLTEELEAIDVTGELELIALEEGRVDLERELAELEARFWRDAESQHPFLTGETPVVMIGVEPAADPDPAAVSDPVVAPEPAAGPGSGSGSGVPTAASVETAAESTARPPDTTTVAPPALPAPPVMVELEPEAPALPIPEEYAALRPNRPAIAQRRRALRLRRRVIVTALTVAVAAACVGVTARVIGGTHPRRDVTVSVDGRANTVVTRAGTVADVLAASGVVIHPGDRVIPSLATPLSQGMPIHIQRAFSIVADVDGVVAKHRTIHHDLVAVRRQLHVPAAMVLVGAHTRLARGAHVVFRTPHDLTFVADGATTQLKGITALTVADLLASRSITLGPHDELQPAVGTRLTSGMTVQLFRLAEDMVSEEKTVPFTTEYHDDSTLAAGHLRTVRAGVNGTAHVISKVVRQDGVIKQWTEVQRVVVKAPVSQVVARGTKKSGSQVPPPAPATGGRSIGGGYATWYQSHAGPGSCAHLTLPFGTIVRLVANNGRSAQCRVGDRGPEAWTGNSIDLNPDVFSQLAPLGTGRIYVTMSIVG